MSNIITPASWAPSRRIERQHQRSLKHVGKMLNDIIISTNDPDILTMRLNALSRDRFYQKHCESIAMKTVTQLYTGTNTSWRQAALNSSKGQEIYKTIRAELKDTGKGQWLQEQIALNAAKITSIPAELAAELAEEFTELSAKGALEGKRSEVIKIELLNKAPSMAEYKVERIGRTEISKSQTGLIQARSLDLGLPCYYWRTSEDSRVRSSHDFMNGVIVFWHDPPSPEALNGEKYTYGKYHAGCIFNCRCYPEPIIDVKYMKGPYRVYYNGAIRTMSRAEFLALYQAQAA